MATRRGIRIVVAVTLGLAALILNPWFGVTSGFDYGAPEMRAAIEGTWRLTLTPDGEPRREITVRIAQGAAASQPQASSHALVRTAAACGNRSLVRTAGACLDTSEMPLDITVLAGATPADNACGVFRVMGTSFLTGTLDARIADMAVVGRIAPSGQVSSVEVSGLAKPRALRPTLERIAR